MFGDKSDGSWTTLGLTGVQQNSLENRTIYDHTVNHSKSFSRFFFFLVLPSTEWNVAQLFPGRCPRVCHRLDFRVSGPVLVATAEETMRDLD